MAKFSPAGKVLWQIGGDGASDPDLAGLFKFSGFDVHGRLVAVNDAVNRVLYIDPSGHKVDAFSPSTAGSPTGHVCTATVDAAREHVCLGLRPAAHRAHAGLRPRPPADRGMAGHDLLPAQFARFCPGGEVFALATDGSILKLHITVPGA